MKSKFILLSGLLCMCGTAPVMASDCLWDDCEIGSISKPTQLEKPAPLPEPLPPIGCNDCDVYGSELMLSPAQSVNIVSVKPVVADDRPPVWDGQTSAKTHKLRDKTVDWRDGVPIWDDSISHYRDKNFYDYFLDPTLDVYFVDEIINVQSDIASLDSTLNQIEELLVPMKPSADLWSNKKYTAQDLSTVVNTVFEKPFVNNVAVLETDDGCPFETESDCAIWRRKPMVRETVSPRSPKIRDAKMGAFIAAVSQNNCMSANTDVAAPLLERYKMLMQSARACCTDGMVYSLRTAGATDGLVYKFMSDDANFYGLGNRCLMMTDADLAEKFPNTATSAIAADVRNGCLCRGRQWFSAMLAPYVEAYNTVPGFAAEKFNYTYTDGLQREITVSINTDVQNVLNQLSMCP
ncbi:hypothetical protein LJC18_01960 [Lachnospiraceae bacterium OttesenSCG-928-E19]|nr:hypothetical protein [Lachnospiraceae bacterium OttesenSCG-928-E19]